MFDVKLGLSDLDTNTANSPAKAETWFARRLEQLVVRIGARWLYLPISR